MLAASSVQRPCDVCSISVQGSFNSRLIFIFLKRSTMQRNGEGSFWGAHTVQPKYTHIHTYTSICCFIYIYVTGNNQLRKSVFCRKTKKRLLHQTH